MMKTMMSWMDLKMNSKVFSEGSIHMARIIYKSLGPRKEKITRKWNNL